LVPPWSHLHRNLLRQIRQPEPFAVLVTHPESHPCPVRVWSIQGLDGLSWQQTHRSGSVTDTLPGSRL
ncbi:MAG: hypothetical protein VB858_04335, partial [Planctomycetaceae bacterium]